MPRLTRQEIEQIGQRVLRAYGTLPRFQGQEVAMVSPEVLIGELLGLTVAYHKLSKDGRLLGLTCFGAVSVRVYDEGGPGYCLLDGKTLLVERALTNEGANVGRLNFTLVHEACHQIYRMLYPREYLHGMQRRRIYTCVDSRASLPGDWEEWRTNALTSAILMPMDMVVGNMQRFGLGDKLSLLNRVFAPEEYACFSEMADFMGVSKAALAIRMKQLGLLDNEYLENPYDLVNVYPDDEEMKRLQ